MKIKFDPKPFPISDYCLPNGTKIGIGFCPGHSARHDIGFRNLQEDLFRVKNWGATTIVTLIEPHEFKSLGVEELEKEVMKYGIDWVWFPIKDCSTPNPSEFKNFKNFIKKLIMKIEMKENLFIHCRGGLGRSGIIAVEILKQMSVSPDNALATVRSFRPGAVETLSQEHFVLKN